MSKLSELKRANKDLDRAVVKLKGLPLGESRILQGHFPAAIGYPFVRLAVEKTSCHRFEVEEIKTGYGENESTLYILSCNNLTLPDVVHYSNEVESSKSHSEDFSVSGDSFEIARFEGRERAMEALMAIQHALNRSNRWWIGATVLALAYVVLFMPLPNSRNNTVAAAPSAQQIQQIQQMQQLQQMQQQQSAQRSAPNMTGGLQVPQIGGMTEPGALAPSSNGPTPPTPLNAGSPAPVSSEEDPFGLNIGSTTGALPATNVAR